jgi:hypothetical protein
MFVGISLFYFTFFVRELDTDEMNGVLAVLSFTRSPIFLSALALAWVTVAIPVLFRLTGILKIFRDWVVTFEGHLLMAAGLFYVLGDFFEKNLLGLSYGASLFAEEMTEINATTLMVLSAISTLVWAKGQKSQTTVVMD